MSDYDYNKNDARSKSNLNLNLINQFSKGTLTIMNSKINTLNPSFCIANSELYSHRESINQDEKNQLIKEFAKSKNLN